MKVILVMVATVNGKTTKGDSPGTTELASIEDQDYFFQTLQANNLLIMGRSTYEAARSSMQMTPGKLRIILTSNPQDFQKDSIDGQVEFSSLPPKSLLENLEKRGFTQGVLLGGARTNTEFLKEKLVDELWLTLEPKIFGQGNDLLSSGDVDLTLRLLHSEKLNDTGTLLLKYEIN
jgi:dihydrofolate reductase